MEALTSFITVIQKGGFFIYPIIICSIVGLAIFLQKFWQLRRRNVIPEKFLTILYNFLDHGELKEASILCKSNNSTISRIAETAISSRTLDKNKISENVERTGQLESIELGRYIEGLGAVSNVSTLLGLLGTISGMIKIFRVISEKDIVNPPALAGGISEALYTTALGLAVAIPAFIAYKYISGRYEESVVTLEQEAKKIVELVSQKSNPTL